MSIEICKVDVDAIHSHGEETFPNECCGFILGTVEDKNKKAVELLRADNDRESENQFNRFLITPEAYMRGDKAARSKGLDIVGFYHSHPDAPARPSQYDLDHAWPFYSYVIVSIMDGKWDKMTSWVLNEDRSAFDEEDIVEIS